MTGATVEDEQTLPAGHGLLERGVGRPVPERADGSEHCWDDQDEPFDDEPVCPCCAGDGMDPMTDYALPCPECGGDYQ